MSTALSDSRPGMISEAVLSDDLVYRYVLNRRWGLGDEPVMTWIGLNPSTADHFVNDPTIRRMMTFALREGCRGICVLNLYALRSPDPRLLLSHPDPAGPDNDRWLTSLTAEAVDGPVIAAWGAHHAATWRADVVAERLAGVSLQCLGTNRDGSPKHPLARGRHRISEDAPLRPWRAA